MTVHFIGAGPGAADLITLRGRDLIARCPVCLYAGSLVPKALLDHCPPGARIVDTAPLDLDAIVAQFREAYGRGEDVARLHSGDLSIFSALGEQTRRLDALGDPLHDHARRSRLRGGGGRAGARADFAGSRAIRGADPHRRARLGDAAARDLAGLRGDRRYASHPSLHSRAGRRRRGRAAVLWRLVPRGCRGARVMARRADSSGAAGRTRRSDARSPVERTALILVGPALAAEDFRESALYDPDYVRRFRGGPASA